MPVVAGRQPQRWLVVTSSSADSSSARIKVVIVVVDRGNALQRMVESGMQARNREGRAQAQRGTCCRAVYACTQAHARTRGCSPRPTHVCELAAPVPCRSTPGHRVLGHQHGRTGAGAARRAQPHADRLRADTRPRRWRQPRAGPRSSRGDQGRPQQAGEPGQTAAGAAEAARAAAEQGARVRLLPAACLLACTDAARGRAAAR